LIVWLISIILKYDSLVLLVFRLETILVSFGNYYSIIWKLLLYHLGTIMVSFGNNKSMF